MGYSVKSRFLVIPFLRIIMLKAGLENLLERITTVSALCTLTHRTLTTTLYNEESGVPKVLSSGIGNWLRTHTLNLCYIRSSYSKTAMTFPYGQGRHRGTGSTFQTNKHPNPSDTWIHCAFIVWLCYHSLAHAHYFWVNDNVAKWEGLREGLIAWSQKRVRSLI